jgi:hypothetical protein
MTLPRLNGWDRIGIVISGAWMLFVFTLAVLASPADNTFFYEKAVIVANQSKIVTGMPKEKSASGTFVSDAELFGPPEEFHLRITWLLIALFIPPIVAWLFVRLIYGVIRWVVAGFKNRAT